MANVRGDGGRILRDQFGKNQRGTELRLSRCRIPDVKVSFVYSFFGVRISDDSFLANSGEQDSAEWADDGKLCHGLRAGGTVVVVMAGCRYSSGATWLVVGMARN